MSHNRTTQDTGTHLCPRVRDETFNGDSFSRCWKGGFTKTLHKGVDHCCGDLPPFLHLIQNLREEEGHWSLNSHSESAPGNDAVHVETAQNRKQEFLPPKATSQRGSSFVCFPPLTTLVITSSWNLMLLQRHFITM